MTKFLWVSASTAELRWFRWLELFRYLQISPQQVQDNCQYIACVEIGCVGKTTQPALCCLSPLLPDAAVRPVEAAIRAGRSILTC
jgi:hypothetical protein